MMLDTIVGIERGSVVLEKVSNTGERRTRLLSIPATNMLYDTEKKMLSFFASHMQRVGTGQEKMLFRDCVIQGRVLDLILY